MPAVLITAAAGWMAGRVQSQGTYHGAVDAVRRAAQREAYADLFRAAGRFIDTYKAVELADMESLPPVRDLASQPLPPSVRVAIDQMYDAQETLEHAVNMVRLEGPEKLAEIADRIWANSVILAGENHPWFGRRDPLIPRYVTHDTAPTRRAAEADLKAAHTELLPAARRYLNGGRLR
jgi:hypothetical protein